MRGAYVRNNLRHHPVKAQYRVFDGIFWGVSIDGIEGWATTPIPKFSVLVMSDKNGATVLEAPVPQQ